MSYFTRLHRRDSILLLFLSLGITLALGLTLAGRVYRRATPSIEGRTGCGIEDLPSRIRPLLNEKSRFIAVVGDGVPAESLVEKRPYNTQFAQGYDMYQGVNHALQSAALKYIQKDIGVLYVDDGGNPACAARIADILAEQPHLLGVIGHSTTSCTKAALPAYASANIPVLIAAATNPSLLESTSKNCFRLPSNDAIQALVIADMIVNKFGARTVFVVWDATAEASEYSDYLKTKIQHYLSNPALLTADKERTVIIEGSYPISLNPLNYTYLFRRIVSSAPDVVVFAGYGSLAREFLFGLDYEYSQYGDQSRPKVILTDGCKISDIKGYSFDTYLTFAAPPLKGFDAFKNFNRGKLLSPFQKMYLQESFELFGYDAAVLLLTSAKVVLEREQSVSRRQIMRYLKENDHLIPTLQPYAFSRGENTKHRYYCYSLNEDDIACEYNEEKINALLQRVNRP